MRLNIIILAGGIAFSVLGCSDEAEPPVMTDELCSQLDVTCAGDMICGETECEVAFPREYRAHLNVSSPTPDRLCEIPIDCPRLPVTVYYGESAEPILDSRNPGVAFVNLVEGSSFTIDIDGEVCVVPMTAQRLRTAPASCSRNGMSAYVHLSPMPLDAGGDER